MSLSRCSSIIQRIPVLGQSSKSEEPAITSSNITAYKIELCVVVVVVANVVKQRFGPARVPQSWDLSRARAGRYTRRYVPSRFWTVLCALDTH